MQFTVGGFLFGAIIMIIGILMLRYYKEISDNMLSGLSSYDRVRMWGLAITIIGVGLAFGLIQFLLMTFLRLVFPGLD